MNCRLESLFFCTLDGLLHKFQVRLLTVNDEVASYAHEVAAEMKKAGIRAEVLGGASISKLVRNAQTAKIPVACVVGKAEVENKSLSVRLYGGEDLGALNKEEVISRIVKAIISKSQF
jgi:threonyl-tRNA synthetase